MKQNKKNKGLYNPKYEHDGCGIGLICSIDNKPSHHIVKNGLQILKNLEHRGAVGADPKAGDGSGCLTHIPHKLFDMETQKWKENLPKPGHYGVAQCFLPKDKNAIDEIKKIFENTAKKENMHVIGYRTPPTDPSLLGESVKNSEPEHLQIFIKKNPKTKQNDFERKLYILRKVFSNTIREKIPDIAENTYPISCSSRTIIYKGLILGKDIEKYYKDLQNPNFISPFALIHQRFSTNTFPSWPLAHPYRMICHNGEINTLRGNYNRMAARQAQMTSKIYGDDLQKLWPISYQEQSDSACLDNTLELLHLGGYELPHAMMMLVPEAWQQNTQMNQKKRAFYEYHAAIMEPWDGPAAIAFTNGIQIGATLDRNGLRPARWCLTKDNILIFASEAGALDIPEKNIIKKDRLRPGKMLIIDLQKKAIIDDAQLKQKLANQYPYQKWIEKNQIKIKDLPEITDNKIYSTASLRQKQKTFGYTQEDIKILIAPMAETGQEAVGSMGEDTPLSVLSKKPKLLPTYFKQLFAQVTNPPIDPIREEIVMSLISFLGPDPNLFDQQNTPKQKRLQIKYPLISNTALEKMRALGDLSDNGFRTITLDITYEAAKGAKAMESELQNLMQNAQNATEQGYNIIILSDRYVARDRIPIPALLALSATHQHLIRKGLRTAVGLIVETGEAREIHHFCTLAGYGADAMNPWLAFETLENMAKDPYAPIAPNTTAEKMIERYIKAIDKGILKVMSKMGISTYQSYCGAQIFDAVGLNQKFIDTYFTNTNSIIDGIGIDEIAEDSFKRHQDAFNNNDTVNKNTLDIGGHYAYRIRGENHIWTPDAVAHLQHAVRTNSKEKYQQYIKIIRENEKNTATIRDLFQFKSAQEINKKPIPIEHVEPVQNIVRRFATGAMSFGSISIEAHTTLAIAMNRINGKSNTGEGGEEASRFKTMPNGDSKRSAIKQIASGRFGVTTEYLVNADMIQIKMAQGAKPGEGGQLPGHKVNPQIAKIRYSTPGVALISPPPHHDIYSIEDIAQLIFDLKNVNPNAQISVKLVAEPGVGTIAAGVTKARADHITISGYEGGTGASPLTSIKHAGCPWEIGLAETQQTLIENKLRDRVILQADGGMRTAHDVITAFLLGADEIGFSTTPLIATGCLMMRKCHLNTCPVGIATQDPVLRKKFTGTPEHVINFFFLLAEEIRAIMADMGIAHVNHLIGKAQYIKIKQHNKNNRAAKLDLSKLLYQPDIPKNTTPYQSVAQKHPIDTVLDRQFIKKVMPYIEQEKNIAFKAKIKNSDRTVGAMLSGEIAKRYGNKGLREDSVCIDLQGTAGQSFAAFLAAGIALSLEGEANDYVGKGLSGGRIAIYPPKEAHIIAHQSIIIGNTALYGAIRGEAYFAGVAGERFAVRNSGAIAVVEGTGDHGCEYMTGGIVVVLGETGINFSAGMSGGIAYVLDETGNFHKRCNLAMVELEPVSAEEEIMQKFHHHGGDLEGHGMVDISEDISQYDQTRLHTLITKHAHYTNSKRAQHILKNWNKFLPLFVKIMPIEYRKALDQMEQRHKNQTELKNQIIPKYKAKKKNTTEKSTEESNE